jgi:MFS family permease
MQALTSDIVRNSFGDGIFATMFATLTSGVFLTGFALYLGMDVTAIGLLAAIPYAATLFQLPVSVASTRRGNQKPIAIGNAFAGRLLWLLILAAGLLPIISPAQRVAIVLGLVFFSHACISVSYVAWLSWMSDLVPATQLGRFFGTRNMLNGAAGMMTMVGFGWLLGRMTSPPNQHAGLGFAVVFMAAAFFGMTSIGFMRRVVQPPPLHNSTPSTLNLLRASLRSSNFRRFLAYDTAWSFSVFFASPFFTLYFLRELHFSYTFVAVIGMLAALADLVAMRLWGVVSDRIRNRTVIRTCSAVAVFLPLLWTFARPGDRLFPIGLNIVGSFFWAGITLCTNNMVLRMASRTDRAVFISLHNIAAGLGAALAPVVAGIAAKSLGGDTVSVLTLQATPLQVIFLVSTGMRLASLQLLRRVQEPDVVPDQRVVRVLRNVRGLNTASGFNGVLHPFVPAPRPTATPGQAGPDPGDARAALADDRSADGNLGAPSAESACIDGRQQDTRKQELPQ